MEQKGNPLFFALALAGCLAFLCAGFWPFQFQVRNGVTWKESGSGLVFSPPGLVMEARARVDTSPDPEDKGGTPGETGYLYHALTLEMGFKALDRGEEWIGTIFSLYDEELPMPLIVGQWKDYLVMRTRTRESGQRRAYVQLDLPAALPTDRTRHLTLTSGPEGTVLYLDGRVASRHPHYGLAHHRVEMGPARITLGNDPLGRNAWTGEIHYLALHDRVLSETEVLKRHQAMAAKSPRDVLHKGSPRHLYLMEEGEGDSIHDTGTHPAPLCIPQPFRILRTQMLYSPATGRLLGGTSLGDRFFNIIAFALVAFLFMAHFGARAVTGRGYLMMGAFVLCGIAGLSLGVEILQTWLPGRHSSLMDWICNVTGAASGWGLYTLCFVRRKGKKPEESSGP